MTNVLNSNLFNYKSFLRNIQSKKSTIKIIKKKILKVSTDPFLVKHKKIYNVKTKVHYILAIKYTSANTFVQLSNSLGKVIFYCSAGYFFKGKQKTSRFLILKKFINVLFLRFSFLQEAAVSLHFFNVFNRRWVVKYLRKKVFITNIKTFAVFAHNGCRNRKVKRKKFKKKLHLVYTN